MALQAKRYSVSTYLKFFLFSAFGVFAFFINFNLYGFINVLILDFHFSLLSLCEAETF